MGKVVVSQFITVDGVIEDPGGVEGLEQGGWAFKFTRGPEGDQFKFDEVMASARKLCGPCLRREEIWAKSRPERGSDRSRADERMPACFALPCGSEDAAAKLCRAFELPST